MMPNGRLATQKYHHLHLIAGLVGFLVLSMLGGCNSFALPDWLVASRPTPTLVLPSSPTPVVTQALPISSPTPSGPIVLTIWVPPQFNPDPSKPGGDFLADRLEQFKLENPGILINIRVKSLSGPANLLDSLMTTLLAAPDAMPSLVILPRNMMEAAALKEMVLPLNGLISLDDEGWYPYARQLASINDSIYGFPFAGDGLMLILRPAKTSTPPRTWEELILWNEPIVFAAADPKAYLPIMLYQAFGGSLSDADGHPSLQLTPLTQMLDIFSRAAQQQVFNTSTITIQSESDAWQAYNDMQADAVLTLSSHYLASLPGDSAAIPLPAINPSPVSMLDGWLVCLSDPIPERRALAIRLAEFLVDPAFLAEWSQQAGYLPTHSSSLVAWKNQSLRNLLSGTLPNAPIIPDAYLTSSLGPILRDATIQVLERNQSPLQAAQDAINRIGTH